LTAISDVLNFHERFRTYQLLYPDIPFFIIRSSQRWIVSVQRRGNRGSTQNVGSKVLSCEHHAKAERRITPVERQEIEEHFSVLDSIARAKYRFLERHPRNTNSGCKVQ